MEKNSFKKIPDGFIKKWQEIADLIANIMDLPAALIMKTEKEFMEVFTSSNTENNPYNVGDKEHWHGLYCETVIKTQKKLSIPNALKDKNWDKNPDIKLGMIAYLGFPINFPDQKPFGTLCVLDTKERHFNDVNENLLLQFKKVIELDLALIFSLGLKEDYSHVDIIQKLSHDKIEYQSANEELKKTRETLKNNVSKIKHSNDLLDYIIRHNRSAVAVHDKDLKYIYVSQKYIDEFNVKESDILGKHHYEVFPELPQKWRKVHQKALAGEISSAEKDPFYRNDGSVQWTRWECRPWYESDGTIGGIIIYTEVINERIEAEEELKSNYALLQIAGQTAKFGGWHVNLEKNICIWSDAVADIHEMPHGYSPPLKEGISFYAPEWWEKITKVFNDCAQMDIPYDEEMEIITAKGNRVWVRTIGKAVKDENNKIIGVAGSFQDITKQRLYQNQIQEKNEFIQTVLDKLPIGIAINEIDKGNAIYMNEQFTKIYGWPEEELKDVSEFFNMVYPDEDYRNTIQKRVTEDISSGDASRMHWENIKVTHKDGSHRYVNAFNIPLIHQNVMVSTVMDITGIKKAEESLQRIEWMLSKKAKAGKWTQTPVYGDLSELNTSRLILDSVGKKILEDIASDTLRLLETATTVYEKNGDFTFGIFASSWCSFIDQASRELCGTNNNKEAPDSGKWLCHEFCWKEASLSAIESGRLVDIECKGGIHLYALPVYAGNEVIGAISFGYGDPPQDQETLSELAEKYKVPVDELLKRAKEYETRPPYIIEMAKERLQVSANLIGEIVSRKSTEKKILELNEQLEDRIKERTEQLEASNKELEAFSYSVSHDLRAPLRHINGYVNMLNEKFHSDLPEKAQYYLTTVSDAAKQMGTLIDDLLQFSRTSRQEMEKTKIEMNVLVKDVIEIIKQSTEKREIIWKVQDLPQVFGDLVMLKQVWVNLLDNAVKYTRNTQKAKVSIGYKDEKKKFVFFVRDNGVGFNMKYAHKLFGVFQRLHSRAEFDGTGIGLAHSQRIIHKHNGRMWAEAEPGKGATFFFSLPKQNN